MNVQIEYDAEIRLHRASAGLCIAICFAEVAREKFGSDPERFQRGLNEVEKRANKVLPLRHNHYGQFIVVPVDDQDFAVEEARDLAELLLAELALVVRVHGGHPTFLPQHLGFES